VRRRSFSPAALHLSRKLHPTALLIVLKSLTSYSNAHIYGIDLATSSELIAYHRSSKDIAEVIGADAVIYQTLPDLKAACAKLSPRDPENQEFEVGVFCGKYITPVEDSYFTHLEQIRGERKKSKVAEQARTAVAQGLAGDKEMKIAINGCQVDKAGNVVPIEDKNATLTNGVGGEKAREPTSEHQVRAHPSQDISLHNLNDHPND
jgi:amidophosphoribosyltransferase